MLSTTSAIYITPTRDTDDAEVVSSTIKRDIKHYASVADAMIDSIQQLFTPPGQQQQGVESNKEFHDDGEICDEIQRLPSLADDIRQDLDAQHVLEAIAVLEKKKVVDASKESVKNDMKSEEHRRLVLLVMIAFWIIVYMKEWIEYNPALEIGDTDLIESSWSLNV